MSKREEFINKFMAERMGKLAVVPMGGCKFPNDDHPCPNPAGFASTLDGTPLCSSHIDAYMNYMTAFFKKAANEAADKMEFEEEEIKDDKQEDLQRSKATGAFNKSN